jgi:hypothetical protein
MGKTESAETSLMNDDQQQPLMDREKAQVKSSVKFTFLSGGKTSVTFSLFREPGNTIGGSITVLLTSCLTGLESAV